MLGRVRRIRRLLTLLVAVISTSHAYGQDDWEGIKQRLRSAGKLRIHVSYSGTVNRPGDTYPADMSNSASDEEPPEFLPAASFPVTLDFWLDLSSNRIRRDESYSEWSFGNDAYVDRFDSTVLNEGEVWQAKPPEKHPEIEYNHQYKVGDMSNIGSFAERGELPLYAALGYTFISLELANLLNEDGTQYSRPDASRFAIKYTHTGSGNFATRTATSEFIYDSNARLLMTRTYRGDKKDSECQISDYMEHDGVSIPSAWRYERFSGSTHLEDGTFELDAITSLDAQALERVFNMEIEPGAVVLDAQDRELKRMTDSGELEPYPRSDRGNGGTWSTVLVVLFWAIFVCALAGFGIYSVKSRRR